MVKIAVSGEGGENVSEALFELLRMAGLSVFSYKTTKYGTFKQLASGGADVFIAPIGSFLLEREKENIDMLVFSNDSTLPDGLQLNLVNENAFIIINADDKRVCKYLKGTAANLLTYGFNPKASVTASSIEERSDKNFVQLCIQRSFQATNGAFIEAQEIPVTITSSSGGALLDEIAAITAALALGINLRTISLAY